MAYYTQQLRGREREPGIRIKRRVKLAAKLLLIAWTLMKKGELFRASSRGVSAPPICPVTEVKP